MLFLPATDGIDHINVYSKGKTLLGRQLSNFSECNITIEHEGFFRTLEGYWYWLSTHDDRLRTCLGAEAKKLGRSLRGKESNETPDFVRRFRHALDLKLDGNPQLLKSLREKKLPLDHYYVLFGQPRRPTSGKWILEHMEKRARE
jgi:hypothetical protein